MRKTSLLLAVAGFMLSLSLPGCGESATKPISAEEAKQIVGEDPDYLPGDAAAKKGSAKKH